MSVDLLYEIGVEEIPANAVLPALQQLETNLQQGLTDLGLPPSAISTYGTPRRLAVIAQDIAECQPDSVDEHKGPPAEQAFDEDGNPTPAAQGFAQARGVLVSQLDVRDTEKGRFVFAEVHRPGQPAAEVLPDLLRQVALELSFPKTMRWADLDIEFARPIRWLVALLGEEILDLEIAGVRAGRSSRGHRVMGEKRVEIPSASAYLQRLAENGVIADHHQRQEMIVKQAQQLAAEVDGRPRTDADILTEVNFLVEYPTCVRGSFDPSYLDLPPEILVTVLRGHQRAFSVEDTDGELMAEFIAVTNARPEAADMVRQGWERVIVPRLDDAKFYYQHDTRQPLGQRREELKRVTFLKGMGNLHQKTARLEQLADWLAGKGEGTPRVKVEPDEQLQDKSDAMAEAGFEDVTDTPGDENSDSGTAGLQAQPTDHVPEGAELKTLAEAGLQPEGMALGEGMAETTEGAQGAGKGDGSSPIDGDSREIRTQPGERLEQILGQINDDSLPEKKRREVLEEVAQHKIQGGLANDFGDDRGNYFEEAGRLLLEESDELPPLFRDYAHEYFQALLDL